MVKVTETELPDGGYEQRYALGLRGVPMFHMIRRPVSMRPPEGTICDCDNGPRLGDITRRGVGVFKDGRWQKLKFEPTHYTDMEPPSGSQG